MPAPGAGPTDDLLCRAAQALGRPVLSEDKQVLRQARRLGLDSYNTLMLALALCAQGHLPLEDFPRQRERLRGFARYGAQVLAVGDAVYRELLEETAGS